MLPSVCLNQHKPTVTVPWSPVVLNANHTNNSLIHTAPVWVKGRVQLDLKVDKK